MSSLDRIPPELWLEIFSLIPRDILADISLTSRTFHRVVHPVLFTHFTYYTKTAVLEAAGSAELSSYMERLYFWSSDEIGPLVRSCSITPFRVGYNYASACSDLRVAPFLERLPRFTGLQRLYADGVSFPRSAMAVLCRLPALDHLELDVCRTVGELHLPGALHISDSLSDYLILRPTAGCVCSIDHLRQLELCCEPLALADTLPIFPHVHELSASWWKDPLDIHKILVFLSKFPALEVLTLQRYGAELLTLHEAGARASRLFPLLREYTGAACTLPVFLPLPTLACLTVSICNPHELFAQLEEFRPFNKITSLTVSFSVFNDTLEPFDNTALSTLCGLFPQLQELRVAISHYGAISVILTIYIQPAAFLEALPQTPLLPPSLESLYFAWNFDWELEYDVLPPPENLPEFAALRDALVMRCPDLTALCIDGEDFIDKWRKYSDGTVVEATADNWGAFVRLNDFSG
ncbi:hypothetical protein B0H17DRAFT_1185095 [Mycena rosella]|uniref:F-box domain-containing protein n=1 Tax=Mycena rosella TaxID=1033263 RepID=A0AAD7G2W0_MYCRO|nr:hypothetical protein B0H17DRAFT_1185095 [Mycena rosella]